MSSLLALSNRSVSLNKAAMKETRRQVQAERVQEAANSFRQLPGLEESFLDVTRATFAVGYLKGYYSSRVLLEMFDSLGRLDWTLDGCNEIVKWNKAERFGVGEMKEPTTRFSQLPVVSFLHKLRDERPDAAASPQFQQMWSRIASPTLRAIVTRTPLEIDSAFRNEKLYAVDASLSYDEHRRNVFCWRDKWTSDGDKEKWLFIPVDRNNESVYIQSVYSQEYLYAADYAKLDADEHGRIRSRVFTWRPKDKPDRMCEWVVVSLDNETFALYNPAQRQFLYAPDDTRDDRRRFVFNAEHLPLSYPWLNERRWHLKPAYDTI